MRISFKDLGCNAYGELDIPTLILQKPHGEIIGVLGHAFGLNLELKFNELSEGSFSYPKFSNGEATPYYDVLVSDKLIDISPIGIFVIAEVTDSDDGAKKKEIFLRSREYELASKDLVFAEGTYNLWNPADQENTMLGMVLENAPGWKIGYVSPSLIGRYRTFGTTQCKAIDFLYGDMQESYGCAVAFDTYNRTINVYDADEAVPLADVYLSKINLLKQEQIKENPEEIVTRMTVNGAEGVDIHNVNPTGDNYIYNLDYYIENGDLPDELAQKWISWQNTIFSKQEYYTSLVALRNAGVARKTVEAAALTDLQNELSLLDNTRATFLQMQATVEKNGDTWDYFQERLDTTAVEYGELEGKIAAQKQLLIDLDAEFEGHRANITSVNDELRITSYFSEDELNMLQAYFKDGTFEDNTFAVFDVDLSHTGDFTSVAETTISFDGVTWTDVPCEGEHVMASVSGGKVSLFGNNYAVAADLVSAVVDHKGDEWIASLYLGSGTLNDEAFPSGTLTCVGKANYIDSDLLSGMEKHEDILASTDGSISHTTYYYTGAAQILLMNGSYYFTRNATEYQLLSVEHDLYDFATKQHKEISRPTYEFEVDSGNIVYAKGFEQFKNAIQLGYGCYLQLDEETMLTPTLIEIHIDFEDRDNFKLIFSNRFQRPDNVNKLKDTVAKASSAGRSFENSKFSYGENSNTTTWVKELIEGGLQAAQAQILAGKDNFVTIDQAGIKIDSPDGASRILLNNGMIALLDKRSNTVRLGMGHFLNEATGTDFVGILGDIIGGTLLAGQNLIIECPDPNGGVMQFKVDSSGVILNNGRMYMKTDKGAMGFDANHGFFAGTKDLFDTTDTGYVHPVCIDEDGNMVFDDDGFPADTNVWIGIDGKAYFRGKIYATDGVFNGTVYAKDGEFTGTVNANAGTFKGIIQASDFLTTDGESMLTDAGKFSADYLDLMGLNVVNSAGDTVLTIDENGLRFNASYSPIKYQYSSDNKTWHDTMQDGDKYRRESFDGGLTWQPGYQFVGKDGQNGSSASVPSYIKSTYIDFNQVSAPFIYGNAIRTLGQFQVGTGTVTGSGVSNFVGYGYMGYAEGSIGVDGSTGVTTYGVALSNSNLLDDSDNYLIVTNGGVRMQAQDASVYVDGSRARLEVGGTNLTVNSSGAYVNGELIGASYLRFS